MTTKLSEHFTLEELTFSETAVRKGIDNTPSKEVVTNLKRLTETLEQVRKLLGKPIHISSGYRGYLLNSMIGGAKTSAHLEGRAIDFTCASFGNPLKIAEVICNSKILEEIDQIIMEGSWIHLAIPKEGELPRKNVLTATFSKGKVKYSNGL